MNGSSYNPHILYRTEWHHDCGEPWGVRNPRSLKKIRPPSATKGCDTREIAMRDVGPARAYRIARGI